MMDMNCEIVARRFVGQRDAPALDRPAAEIAWLVLEAANDLGDDAAIMACRRVIDASFNGKIAASVDMDLVVDYFR